MRLQLTKLTHWTHFRSGSLLCISGLFGVSCTGNEQGNQRKNKKYELQKAYPFHWSDSIVIHNDTDLEEVKTPVGNYSAESKKETNNLIG
jgi:hypothetical protein